MIFGTRTSPHVVAQDHSVAQVMRQVLYALLPGTLMLIVLFGWGTLSNLVLGIVWALLLEVIMLKLRQRPLQPFLSDYSVVVTGWLLAIALPPYSPWWLIAIALVFAVIIGKHLYGGLGYNPFNPAMVGYAAVLVSFPLEMTLWAQPFAAGFGQLGFTDMLQQVFGANLSNWDAYTQATPLDYVKVNVGLGQSLASILQAAPFGYLGGKGWELVSIAYLVGGVWLIWRGIISWHIPVGLLAALAGMAGLFWLIDMHTYPSPLFHLLSGASMLGAFFIATDPVSASTTPLGKLLYAGGIGCFTYIIRTWGNYPDAIAFSVLIMNMAVPLLDYYTQPRVYGTRRKLRP